MKRTLDKMENKNLIVFNSWCYDLGIHNQETKVEKIFQDIDIAIAAYNHILRKFSDRFEDTNFEEVLNGLIFYKAVIDTCIGINMRLKKANLIFKFESKWDSELNIEKLYIGIMLRENVRNQSPESIETPDGFFYRCPTICKREFKIDGYNLFPIFIHTTYKELWDSIDKVFLKELTDNYWRLKEL